MVILRKAKVQGSKLKATRLHVFIPESSCCFFFPFHSVCSKAEFFFKRDA